MIFSFLLLYDNNGITQDRVQRCCRIKILHQQVLILGLKLVSLVSLVLGFIMVLPLTTGLGGFFLHLSPIFIILYNHLPFLIQHPISNLKMLRWLPWDYFGIQAFWLPHRTFQGRRTLVAHITNSAESPHFSDSIFNFQSENVITTSVRPFWDPSLFAPTGTKLGWMPSCKTQTFDSLRHPRSEEQVPPAAGYAANYRHIWHVCLVLLYKKPKQVGGFLSNYIVRTHSTGR